MSRSIGNSVLSPRILYNALCGINFQQLFNACGFDKYQHINQFVYHFKASKQIFCPVTLWWMLPYPTLTLLQYNKTSMFS